MSLKTTHLTLSAVCLFFLSCGVPAPAIEEGYLPSDTNDALGPYLIVVKTWGATDRVRIEWRVGEDENSPLEITAMTEVSPDTWEGQLPGMGPGTRIRLSVVAKGPGGTVRFPARGQHSFVILDEQTGCGDGPACDAGLRCINGQCVAQPACLNDADCDADTQCVDGSCIPRAPCDDGCTPEEICVEDMCVTVPDCTNDDDCPNAFICTDTVCIPAPEPGLCDEILCETGLYCDEETGECIECRGDEECEEDATCSNGFCSEPSCGEDASEPNNEPEEAAPLSPEAIVEGRTCGADPDFFRVVEAPQLAIVESLNGGLFILVQDEAGELIVEESLRAGTQTEFSIQPGWVILIFGEGDATSDYLLFTREDGPIECVDDRFEDNDDRETASRLGATGAYIAAASCPDDDDWFRFRRRQRNEPTKILIKGGRGRLAGALQDPDGNEVAAFEAVPDFIGYQSVVYDGNERDIFFRLSCPGCRVGANYALATRSLDSDCRDDNLEPNDNPDQATPIPGNSGFESSGLIVCAERSDFFRLEHEAGRRQRVTVDFNNARGDVDLWVRDENGRLVDAASGTEDGHTLLIDGNEPSGVYFVEVSLFTAGQATYDLAVDGN